MKFYSESYLDENMKNETLREIEKLNNYCKENKIKFIIHNIPELRDLKNYRFNKETNIIKDFAKKNDILIIDTFETLKDYNEKDLWVTNLDPHANDKAHKIIANFLFNNLNKNLNLN